MRSIQSHLMQSLAALLAATPIAALAFSSGSTGADGPLNPTVNTQVPLPDSGVLNYTSVNIPQGVTVTFKRNTANTPVVILASGDVTIAGTIDVSGSAGAATGAAGDGNQGDDGLPGKGGPGGFDGGRGGTASSDNPGVSSNPNVKNPGGSGLGPGGGTAGLSYLISSSCFGAVVMGGAGAGFGASGSNGGLASCTVGSFSYTQPAGGAAYGSAVLLPLIGGSGGGGGGGGTAFAGAGGGGGGGALLIAASGTVNVTSTGSMLANGGAGGAVAGANVGAPGGGGAGGGVRIVATTIAGNGTISATSGAAGSSSSTSGLFVAGAGAGAVGRVRLEAETMTRTAATNPVFSFDAPGAVFVAGFPALTITSVAGVAAPANPTGSADITLPATTPNPVTVVFTTTNVPVGNIVKLTVTPATGAPVIAFSPALTGTTASATASAQVNLPVGPSVLQAQTTYTIVSSLGDALSRYAMGERVERIQLTATVGSPSTATLITVSGKTYEVPAGLLATTLE